MSKDMYDNKDFDGAFKTAMEQVDTEPPVKGWEKVDAELTNIENSKLKKRIVFWIWTSSALFSFIVISGLFLYYYSSNKIESKKQNGIALSPVLQSNNYLSEKKQEIRDENNMANSKLTSPKIENKDVAANKQLHSTAISQKNLRTISNQPIAVTSIEKKSVKNIQNSDQDKRNDHNALSNILESSNEMNQDKGTEEQKIPAQENQISTLEQNNAGELSTNTINTSVVPIENKVKLDSNVTLKSNIAIKDSISIAKNKIPEGENPLNKDLPVKQKISSHFYIEGVFSPEISYHFMKDNNSSDEYSVSYVKTHEVNLISSSEGIKAGYDINKWSIQSGVIYYKQKVAIKACTIYADESDKNNCELVTSSGIVDIPYGNPRWKVDSMGVKDNSYQTLTYLSVPVQVKYLVRSKKISFYILGGISANILIDEKTDVQIKGDKWTKDYSTSISGIGGTKSIYYGYSLGAGASYKFRKGLYISLEPALRGAMSSLNKDTPIKTYPYTIGLGVIAGYHFK